MSTAAALLDLATYAQWVAYSHAKVPFGAGGSPASSANPSTWLSLEKAREVASEKQLPGVGFVFAESDPFVGIDFDKCIDEDGSVSARVQRFVDAFASYTEVSPSGTGLHIWIRGRLPDKTRKRRKLDGEWVECYDRARYFTVTGAHLSGTPETIEERPEALAKLLGWMNAQDDRAQGEIPQQVSYQEVEPGEWLPGALEHISSDPYDIWVKVAQILRAEIGDAAFGIWDQWSARSEKYSGPHDAWKKWRQAGEATDATIKTIIWLAQKGGWVIPEEHRSKLVVEVDEAFRDGWEEWCADVAKPISGLSIVFHDYADVYNDSEPYEPYLIDPLVLGAGDMMLVAGPPKSMKSLLVLDMVRNFALGRSFHGMIPLRPLRVAVVQFELKRDAMRRRIDLAPLERAEVEALRKRLVFTSRFAPVLGEELVTALSEGIRQALDGAPDIIVVDPLANIFDGDNENDNAQMMGFLRKLWLLRQRLNPDAAMILVHHASKRNRDDREAEPFNAIRGGSALRGSYDAALYVEKNADETITVWNELRNGPSLPVKRLRFDGGRFESSLGEIQDAIRQSLLEDAEVGQAHTRSSFVTEYADALGLSPKKLGGILSGMLADELLGVWRPDPMHAIDISARAKGFLGFEGMLFKDLPIPLVFGSS